MSSLVEREQRRLYRQRVLKGASILNGINRSEIGCSIRNMHGDGAELKILPEADVPQQFLLYVPVDGVAYRAELCWRKRGRAGVRFVGTEPKPVWHYG